MDLSEDITVIQSIINDANCNIKPIEKIQFTGGNEEPIKEIIEKLRTFLLSKGYLIGLDNQINTMCLTELRKITFFLILNTDATFKYNLKEDGQICHIVNTIPQLPKVLLLSIIWELNLDQHFYDCITYAPTWFSLQFIEPAVETLKFSDAYVQLERITDLITAIYTNICRSDYRQMDVVDKTISFTKYYNYIMELLRHFFTPDVGKFDGWTELEQAFYLGFVIWRSLKMIITCFELYQSKPEIEINAKIKLFQLMQDQLVNNHSDIYSDLVTDSLHNIYIALLNALQHNVMQITFYKFLIWEEKKIDDANSLQSVVGEAAYQVLNLMKLHECFKHDVCQQLESIARQPIPVEEQASQATIRDICSKLDEIDLDPRIRESYLTSFIKHGSLAFDNMDCLETLEYNLQYLDIRQIQNIILYIAENRKNPSDDDEYLRIKELVVEAIGMKPREIERMTLFNVMMIRNMHSNHYHILQLENFQEKLTQLFNQSTDKLTSNDGLMLMLQNPSLFYDKIFETCLKTEQQQDALVKFMETKIDITMELLEAKIRELVSKLPDLPTNEQKLFPPLISKLYYAEIVKTYPFVSSNVYSHLLTSLEEQHFLKVHCLMKTLILISKGKEDFCGILSEMLVLVGQVLDTCRWDILTYTEQLEQIVELSTEFLQDQMKYFLMDEETDESEIESMLEDIAEFKPMTRYYFHKLTLEKDVPSTPFDKFLHEGVFKNASEVKTFLCSTLIRCTKREIGWLAKKDNLLIHFHDVIGMIANEIQTSTVSNSLACFRHFTYNYLRIVEKVILPSKPSTEKIVFYFKLMELLKKVENLSIYNEIFMNINNNMFFKMTKKYTLQLKKNKNFPTLLNSFKECEAKSLFENKLAAV